MLATLGDIQPEIDPYFGVGEVTKICEKAGRKIMPVVAVMMASSSGAHLTKYSNITDPTLRAEEADRGRSHHAASLGL